MRCKTPAFRVTGRNFIAFIEVFLVVEIWVLILSRVGQNVEADAKATGYGAEKVACWGWHCELRFWPYGSIGGGLSVAEVGVGCGWVWLRWTVRGTDFVWSLQNLFVVERWVAIRVPILVELDELFYVLPTYLLFWYRGLKAQISVGALGIFYQRVHIALHANTLLNVELSH